MPLNMANIYTYFNNEDITSTPSGILNSNISDFISGFNFEFLKVILILLISL
jgi:hypothetical protein